MHRYRFLLFRPLQLLPVLLGISLITFMMVRAIPGDPARILLGVRSTPAALARIRAELAPKAGLGDDTLALLAILREDHCAAPAGAIELLAASLERIGTAIERQSLE